MNDKKILPIILQYYENDLLKELRFELLDSEELYITINEDNPIHLNKEQLHFLRRYLKEETWRGKTGFLD